MGKAIKTTIVIGGQVAKSLQNAFRVAGKECATLDKAFTLTKNIGVTAFKAVATSVAAIGTSVLASAEATREFRSDLSKMYNNAELAGVATTEAWSGLEDLYAISGQFDSANEAMSNLLATGYKGKDLTKIIEAVNGATVKWQDTITQESLADAINETVMSGKSVGQFDEILARSGVNLDTFNDGLLTCTGLAERQQYVLNWLANSGLTEVNSAYQEQNKSLVSAYQADLKYQKSMAELGEVAEPLSALFKGKMASAISTFASKLKGVNLERVSDALTKAGELGSKAFDTLWSVLSKIDWESLINSAVKILEIFTNIFNFVVDNWGTIAPIIYTIVGALTAYKLATTAVNTVTAISNTLKSISAARSALVTGATWAQAAAAGGAAVAQGGLNLAFLACPLTWIVLGIMAVVATFTILWRKCEGFRNFWKGMWNTAVSCFNEAKKAVGAGIDWVVEKVSGLISWLGSLGDWFSNLFGGGEKTINVAVKGDNGKVVKNALGSTITSPTLTWVGEGGDVETIVPHNNKPRSQALALEAVRGTGLNIGGSTYVYSPTINASQGADLAAIRGILEDDFLRFKAQVAEWHREEARLAF